MTDRLTVRVPGTSANLGPGFDSLGLALGLYNTVTIRERKGDEPRVVVRGDGEGILATDERNICYSSAQKLFDLVGVSADFALDMHNDIPLSRGLGSSAAARVGGLVAANEWAGRQGLPTATPQQLLTLANKLEGHPDNAAAALLGGLIVSCCEGDEAVAVRVPVQQWPQFAVWIPDEHLPTKQARSVVPQSLSRADAIFNLSRAALLVAAVTTGDFEALRPALHDKIHQTQRAPLIRGYDAITKAAREAGAIGATLSGAGSTILLWCYPGEEQRQQAEDAVLKTVKQGGYVGRLLWLDVDSQGAVVTD